MCCIRLCAGSCRPSENQGPRPGAAAGKRPGAACGFTLVEALVSMVLVATVGYSVFSLINTHYNTFRRVEDAQRRMLLESSVLEVAQGVNPMVKPTGRVKLGDYVLTWDAEENQSIRSTYSGNGFQVGVYKTHFELLDGKEVLVRTTLLLTGYKE